MSLAAIRAQVKIILSGVSGIGVVHEYERWAASWTDFLAFFKDGSTINGWTITRKATPSEADDMVRYNRRRHQLVMRGFYGLKDGDASELLFQAQVEAVQAAFDRNESLNGTCIQSGPAQVEVVENRVFGTVLCHYAEVTLEAVERVVRQ